MKETLSRRVYSDEEFIKLFESFGPTETSKIIGIAVRNVYERRYKVEANIGRPLATPEKGVEGRSLNATYPFRSPLSISDGTIMIGSDAHYWPDHISASHRGLVKLSEELKPKVLIMNGDVMDNVRNSRHPRIGWAKSPTLKEERDCCEERMSELQAAAKGADLYWNLGNHDLRFETRLSMQAPEYEGLAGFCLKDHFPHWKIGMSVWVNDNAVIKHRFKGGIHATHNNTIWAGKTVVTGHLHSLKVTPFSDYNGTRWGVDTGTLADPYGDQFEYAEDNPLNHRSGFVVLTFRGGKLTWPEIVRSVDADHVEFRGEIIRV